jgi:hypothetical protein
MRSMKETLKAAMVFMSDSRLHLALGGALLAFIPSAASEGSYITAALNLLIGGYLIREGWMVIGAFGDAARRQFLDRKSEVEREARRRL